MTGSAHLQHYFNRCYNIAYGEEAGHGSENHATYNEAAANSDDDGAYLRTAMLVPVIMILVMAMMLPMGS